MKNIVFLLAVFFMISCKESFLDISSQTELTTTVYYKTQSDFEQAINGAYAPLRSLYNGTAAAWTMGEMRSDNTTYKYNANDRGTIYPEYIANFLEDNTNAVLSNKYTYDYTIIARVNQILYLIDDVDFDEETVKTNIKGQAYFLRAFAYFDLVQYFGEVPLHLEPVTSLDGTSLPLSSVEAIYDQIISDATQAIGLLPDKASQEAGRVTSGSAKTLLGNVYIVQENWTEAESVLESITGYSLLDDYADVFDPANKNNSESVFEVQYKQGSDGLESYFFYTFLVQPITASEVESVTGITEIARTVEGFNIPTPDIIDAYETGDLRKDASIGYLTASGKTYPYIKKYAHNHELTYNTDDDWPIYRYSEVLLFLAEALNEQNETPGALQYLNQVRTRAGLSNSPASSQSEIRDAIMQERRVEFAFENKRWPDLVRTNTAEEVMTAFGERVKANPEAYYFPEGITVSSSAYTDIELLFPLPDSESTLSSYF